MIGHDWKVIISHVYREENKCADELANLWERLDQRIQFYEECPQELRFILANLALVFLLFGVRPSCIIKNKIKNNKFNLILKHTSINVVFNFQRQFSNKSHHFKFYSQLVYLYQFDSVNGQKTKD